MTLSLVQLFSSTYIEWFKVPGGNHNNNKLCYWDIGYYCRYTIYIWMAQNHDEAELNKYVLVIISTMSHLIRYHEQRQTTSIIIQHPIEFSDFWWLILLLFYFLFSLRLITIYFVSSCYYCVSNICCWFITTSFHQHLYIK